MLINGPPCVEYKQQNPREKKPAASQVLEDHMAMVCGGVWAVVSVSVPLFGVKRLGGRGEGGLCIYQNTFSLSKHTNTLLPRTIAHRQYHYSSTHDEGTFNPLYVRA